MAALKSLANSSWRCWSAGHRTSSFMVCSSTRAVFMRMVHMAAEIVFGEVLPDAVEGAKEILAAVLTNDSSE